MTYKGSFIEKRILTVVMLAVVMAAGFYVRFDDFSYWQKNRSEFFFAAESLPVAINPDAYYYLDIADEYLEGKVRKIDDRRRSPGNFQKPLSVPLLSFTIASFSKLTGQPVEWVAIFLPVLCGIILAIPLYFLTFHLLVNGGLPLKGYERFNHLEAKIAGLIAGLLALLSPALVMRSSVGWCDTDMLHVSFATISVMLAIMVMKTDTPRKVFLLQAAWTANLLLFLWWWDFAFWPATFLAGAPWFIALMVTFLGKRQAKNTLFLLGFSAVTVMVFSVLFNSSGGLISTIKGLTNYVFEVQGASSFPVPAQHVSEQGNVDFRRLAAGSAGGRIQLVFSLAGLGLLFFLSKRKILVLLPLILVGALSVSGERFLIFTAPLFGLGGAVFVLVGQRLIKDVKIRIAVAVFLAVFLAWGAFQGTQRQNFMLPRTKPALFEGMKEFGKEIPDNSVIWASWGHGHPLIHYTKKKTIGDGIHHPASLLYLQNFPLATSSFQLSANWIKFTSVHGAQGLRKASLVLAGSKDGWAVGMPRLQDLLGSGPGKSREILQSRYQLSVAETEDFLAFLFPADTPPVYLLLDYMYLRERWYLLGKWNLATGRGPAPFTQLRINPFMVNSKGMLLGKSSLGSARFDLAKGLGSIGRSKANLLRLVYEYGGTQRTITYPGLRKGYVMYVDKNDYGEFCLLTDYPAESVFLQLFFEKKFDQGYFRPVKDKSPLYLFCEVTGDKYVGRRNPEE